MIVAFTLLDYIEDLLAKGSLEFELETTALFLFASLGFVLLRYLHKRTRLLTSPDGDRAGRGPDHCSCRPMSHSSLYCGQIRDDPGW